MASLKYKDSTTGNMVPVSVKVGDTLPVNTIVEYDGSTVPTGYIQVDDPNEYSTNEVRIGTWIDGKPLYRKVIEKTVNHTSSTSTTKYQYSLGIANVDTIFIDRGNSFSNGGVTPLDNIFYNNQAISIFTRAAITNTTITYDVYYQTTTDIPLHIVVCYTKTTD